MLSLLLLALTFVAVLASYAGARRFVRERLRFVNAVQRRSAPPSRALGRSRRRRC
jgi:hypothetical protein